MLENQKHIDLAEWKANFAVGSAPDNAVLLPTEPLPEGLDSNLLRKASKEILIAFSQIIDELPDPPICSKTNPWRRTVELDNGEVVNLSVSTVETQGELVNVYFKVQFQGVDLGDFQVGKREGGNEWNLRHRDVHPDLRGSKLGSAMLESLEYFLKEEIKGKSVESSLELETSQLSVICWLLNNDFEGATDRDKGEIQRLLEYIKDGQHDYEIRITTHQRDDTWLQMRRSGEVQFYNIRLKLHKKFSSVSEEVEKLQAEAAKSVDEISKLTD